MSSASSNVPFTGTTRAPWISACASLPSAIWPAGSTTAQSRPARGRVRRGRRRRVAGGRADHDLGAVLDRGRHRHRHAAVLERTGGVRALDLEHDPRDARACRDARARRRSGVLPSSSVMTGVALGDRQPVAEGLDQARATAPHQSSSPTRAPPSRPGARCSTFAQRVEGGEQVGFARAVGDEHQPGVGPDPPLLHRLDRHVVAAELAGDRGEHARAVGRFQEHVERRLDIGHRPDGLVDQARRSSPLARRRRGSWPHRRGRRAPPTPWDSRPAPRP